MLYKNTFKLLKKKKFQLFAVGIIICLSSFIYVAMYNAMNTLDNTLTNYVEETNQQDFSAKINDYLLPSEKSSANELSKLTDIKHSDKDEYEKIINDRISDFKKNYENTNIELRSIKDVSFNYDNNPYKMRVIKDNKSINLSYIENGRKPENNNEIAFPKIFLQNNNLSINDKININNKEYTIVGEILFPDYTLLVFGKDFIIDTKKLTVSLVIDDEYERIKGVEEISFSGKFNENVDDFEAYFNKDLEYISSITDTKSDMTSGYLFQEVQMAKMTVVGISIMITTIAIIMVGIMLFKILQGERGPIGLLKAMGYLNKEIARPYLVLITLVAFPMLIIGSVIGYFVSQDTLDLFAEFYLFPSSKVSFDISVYIISVIIPLVFFTILSYIIIKLIIKKKPLELLKPSGDTKITKMTIYVDKLLKRFSTVTKFKYSFLLRNKGKFFVYILGVCFASFLLILGLMMPQFFSKMSTESYEIEDYKYEAYIDYSKELVELNENEEKFLNINSKLNNHDIVIKGLETDNKLYKLYNDSNEDVTKKLKDGVIISTSFSRMFDKQIGDSVTLKINNTEKDFSIVEISKVYGDMSVYIDRKELSNIYSNNKNEDLYNGIYSDKEINKDNYGAVICKEDIISQSESMQSYLYVALGVILGVSILIAVIILFVLTSLTVEDNYYNISLLKVMGYTKKEVNSMVINSYLGYAIIAYLIAVPLTDIGMKYFVKTVGEKFNMILPIEFKIWQLFVGIILIIVIYFIGTLNAKRKVNKISLQEILKEYRE